MSTLGSFVSSRLARHPRHLIAIVIAGITLAASGAAAASPPQDIRRMHELVFHTPLLVFLDTAQRQTPSDRIFDWSSDLCSAPMIGSTGRSYDFRGPCRRHDFAYRNFKKADLVESCRHSTLRTLCSARPLPSGRWWNSTIRHRIDRQFLADMNEHCSSRQTSERIRCLTWAQVFFRTVRIAGGP